MFLKLEKWNLSCNDCTLGNISVPGDITYFLYENGSIDNPYFGLNHLQLQDCLKNNYVYTTTFDVVPQDFDRETQQLFLTFKGIDTFADVYLNGQLLGKTENMFLAYDYDISNIAKVGQNTLEVKMRSTLEYMSQLDCNGYFGVFNTERVLIRKEQCCFGWDWSPNVPGYGIWQPVILHTENKQRIIDVYCKNDIHGQSIFFVELNYYKRSHYDNDGNFVEVKEKYDDYIRVTVKSQSYESDCITHTIKVEGNKNFVVSNNPSPQLWWPIGYGSQPLYDYTVELLRDGKVISQKQGTLAYRTVELKQKPVAEDKLGYQFVINGKNVYIKGSNWVPVDCFAGCIDDGKYVELIDRAKNANVNLLRIWGGGIYENDVFYDLCDKAGIMVWQDFMLACGDIPDDRSNWVSNMLAECEYQIKRLRNHPSLVYWCGGNEKTGSFGTKVKYGDHFVDVTLRGLVNFLDDTRPYGRQSPWSFTDVANDSSSGESHCNSFEPSINAGIVNYRKTVAQNLYPFVSECAIMGPSSKQTFEKIFPAEKLWPMNEYWSDRLMRNPYAAIRMDFCQEQLMFAEDMYGKCNSIDEYVVRGMMVHAEALKCEAEYQRAHKGKTNGFLSWMFSEIWPSATWALVDYYGEPKQAYYQMAKSYKPVLMSFYYDKDGNTYLFGVNDTLNDVTVSYKVCQKRVDGTVLYQFDGEACLTTNGAFTREVQVSDGTYLVVEYSYDGKCDKSLYSANMWRDVNLVGDVIFDVEQTSDKVANVKLHANSFAKSVFLSLPNNCKCAFSDNYVDLEAGDDVTITVTSQEKTDFEKISVSCYEQKNRLNEVETERSKRIGA